MESEYIARKNKLIEYMKIHLISLIQDLDELHSSDKDFRFIEGQILATRHLLSVVEDIL
jgi:hypothetical protein